MPNYPNRCQHLKINGTQCGSPALRRNRFCFFHKRFQDERIRLNAERSRRAPATFLLPVLEDANSIQMTLMQVMRLLLNGQIEHKTASLLLYALQTASANLRSIEFDPGIHDVILHPADAAATPLDSRLWDDEDFDSEEEEQELDEVEAEAERAAEIAATDARSRVRAAAAAKQRTLKLQQDRRTLEKWVADHPGHKLVVDEDGRASVAYDPQSPKKPAAAATGEEIRAQIAGMVHSSGLIEKFAPGLHPNKEGEKQSSTPKPSVSPSLRR